MDKIKVRVEGNKLTMTFPQKNGDPITVTEYTTDEGIRKSIPFWKQQTRKGLLEVSGLSLSH
jgi:hypothetical protein